MGAPWPGTTPRPGGVYAWDIEVGITKWMHSVSEGSSVELRFALDTQVGPLPAGEPVTVAGFAGTLSEVPGGSREQNVKSYRYVVDMEDVRILIAIGQNADTSEADLARARTVIESIQREAKPNGKGYRLIFTLDDNWDSG